MFWEIEEIQDVKKLMTPKIYGAIDRSNHEIHQDIKNFNIITDNEFKKISVPWKMLYLKNISTRYMALSPMKNHWYGQLSGIPSNIIDSIIDKLECDEVEFNSLPFLWKYDWIRFLVENNCILRDYEFNFILRGDEHRFFKNYINKRIEEGCGLSKFQFNKLNDETKLKYIVSVKSWNDIKDYEKNWYIEYEKKLRGENVLAN